MNWNARQIKALIAKGSDVHASLPVSTVKKLIGRATFKHCAKGSLITYRGQAEPRFCLLLDGLVRMTSFSSKGKETLSIFIHPGNFWGVHPCLGDYPETNDAMAESDCEVLMLHPEVLKELMWADHELQALLIQFLCARLNLALHVVNQYSAWTPRERLPWRIAQLLQDAYFSGIGQAGKQAEVSIAQESLAAMINLSRQRTNKILKDLEQDGVICIRYGRIRVNSIRRLKQEYPAGRAVGRAESARIRTVTYISKFPS